MSKVVYACVRDSRETIELARRADTLSARLAPDNMAPLPCRAVDGDGTVIRILNPTTSLAIRGRSVALGCMFDADEWDRPGGKCPDGTFALFRGDDQAIEVLTDVLASRTIWFFFDERRFIASTSQRAIITLLGDFQFDDDVISWMLSSGSLGPRHAWDRRLRRLGGDASLSLDRDTWTLTERSNAVPFAPVDLPDSEHEARMRRAIGDTFDALRLDWSKWVLPLSGGVDSRAILCMLPDRTGLRTVTWGLRSSMEDQQNDAYIAAAIARSFAVQHRYYETDVSQEPVDVLFNRYCVCGEGRIDHISGYMDGFELWRKLSAGGVEGIIRGDQAFGLDPLWSAVLTRNDLGMTLWADFDGILGLESFGMPSQHLPPTMAQQAGESFEGWRDRNYQEYRVPIVLAALTDLKLPFVEVVNPFLSRRIIYETRRLPDHLRVDKHLFKTIVDSVSPQIAYARRAAPADVQDILHTPNCVTFLADTLESGTVRNMLPKSLVEHIRARLRTQADDGLPSKVTRKGARLKHHVPAWLRRARSRLRRTTPVDHNRLAFRIYVLAHMHDLLSLDAAGAPGAIVPERLLHGEPVTP